MLAIRIVRNKNKCKQYYLLIASLIATNKTKQKTQLLLYIIPLKLQII